MDDIYDAKITSQKFDMSTVSDINSFVPLHGNATTGVPHAMDSIGACAKASWKEGIIKKSAAE